MPLLLPELMAEVWAMEPSAIAAFLQSLNALDLNLRGAEGIEALAAHAQSDAASREFEVRDGVARIDLAGPMIKDVPFIAKLLRLRVAGTRDVGDRIRAAASAASVRSILLNIDSPGGTWAGTEELGEAVRRAAAAKPVIGFVDGMCASAAYWAGSHSTALLANSTAQIGSIGAYSVITDTSRAAENEGVRVHVLRSSAGKGGIVPGAPVTQDALAEQQARVDQMAEQFVQTIARARGVDADQIREHATGQVWLAADALRRGLIDRVASLAEAEAYAAELSHRTPNRSMAAPLGARRGSMPKPIDTPDPAAPQLRTDDPAARLAALEIELATERQKRTLLEQENEVRRASLGEVQAKRRDEVVERAQAEGRVLPSMRASVDAFAATCGEDLGRLEKFLADLPVQTRPTAIGNSGEKPRSGPEPKADGLSEADRRACKAFGLTSELYLAANAPTLRGLTSDGQAVVVDDANDKRGRFVPAQAALAISDAYKAQFLRTLGTPES